MKRARLFTEGIQTMLHCRRHTFAVILGLWCAALVCAQAVAAEQKGLLWKIERDGVKPSFLLGTMHSEDARVLKIAPEVQRAFDGSSIFTMEVVLDTQAISETAQAMVFSDGRNLKTVLGNELYNKIVPLMAQHEVPEMMLPSFKPWAIFLTLSMPPAKTGVFLDAAFSMINTPHPTIQNWNRN
ncbi:MAG: TraB/GumN family protein [Gammaproteobacteria bacterium]|nr:TraB/GumN family protein [Gammaproteobacteria bacterium]